jgi:hypothetical protein
LDLMDSAEDLSDWLEAATGWQLPSAGGRGLKIDTAFVPGAQPGSMAAATEAARGGAPRLAARWPALYRPAACTPAWSQRRTAGRAAST